MENEKPEQTKRELPDVLTVSQAAKEAGITPSAVRNAIYEGKLQKSIMLGLTVIERDEFQRWRKVTALTSHAGRPKGAKNKPKQAGEASEPNTEGTQH